MDPEIFRSRFLHTYKRNFFVEKSFLLPLYKLKNKVRRRHFIFKYGAIHLQKRKKKVVRTYLKISLEGYIGYMVTNINMVLDAGENKYLAENKMTINHVMDINCKIIALSRETIKRPPVWDSDEEEYIDGDNDMDNPNYKRPTPIINKWIGLDKWAHDNCCLDHKVYLKILQGRRQELLDDPNYSRKIYDYLGIIPFNPCVMINISPDWKGKAPPLVDIYRQLLCKTISTYLNSCNRYSKYRYCLECGGEGNFLHAHIVAEINPDLHKSVKTHINKGNHKYELIKAWTKISKELGIKQLKGIEGFLKGKFAVQRIMLNTIAMRDDKLKYLYETNKPEGHKNAYDLNWIRGDL